MNLENIETAGERLSGSLIGEGQREGWMGGPAGRAASGQAGGEGRVSETWWTSEGGFCARRAQLRLREAKLLSMGCPKPGATPSVSLRISAPYLRG